jgi:acetyl esterase/lipase
MPLRLIARLSFAVAILGLLAPRAAAPAESCGTVAGATSCTVTAAAAAAAKTRQARTYAPRALVDASPAIYHYGADARQVFDAYVDPVPLTGAGRPWVVVVHGGSWINGTKANTARDAAAWNAEGFAVFNIEYRRPVDAYGKIQPGGAWPAARIDVELAVRYVKAHAADFGIDPNRGALYGVSAGGHLAALAQAYYNSSRAVVTESGVLEPDRLRDVVRLGGKDGDQPTKEMVDLLGYEYAITGCSRPDFPECAATWKTFTPASWLTSTQRAAWYLVGGSTDPAVPAATIPSFVSTLTQYGVDSTTYIAQGEGHVPASALPGGSQWPEIVSWMHAKTS